MRIRTRGAVVLTITAALTLAACGGDDDTSTDDDAADDAADVAAEGDESGGDAGADLDIEPGDTMTVWTFGATGLEPLMDEWAAEQGVTIEYKTSDFDAHHEQLQTALAAGAVPDIAVIEVGYSSLFKDSPQVFTDLRDHGADDIQGDYLDWRWEQGVAADGTVIGIPTDVGGLAVAYRTDLFEAAGLPTDREEVAALWPTWEDFLQVGQDYVAATGEPFVDDAGLTFETVSKQGSEPGMYNQDGEPVHDSSPQVAKAWDIASQAASLDGFSANLAAFSPEWNTAMAQGAYAVQLAPAWMKGYIAGQAPDTAGLWDIASMPEGGGNWGGSQLTVPLNAEHPVAAAALIKEVLSPEAQLQVFVDNGNFPSTPVNYDLPEIADSTDPFFSDAPTGQIYTQSMLDLTPAFEGVDQRAILREFGAAIDLIENGQATPDEAYEQALSNISSVVG